MKYKIPKEAIDALEQLEGAGFEAHLVGGCVRDLLMGREPKDWDITTNARPEEIQKIFPDSFYENDYGTVGVVTGSENLALKVIEITPYRLEAKYSDKRHPDAVKFSDSLEEDLKRRDFTVNAMALRLSQLAYLYSAGMDKSARETGEIDEGMVEVVDLWNGKNDLKEKIIRTVGEAADRFDEDALRILRAFRLSAELDFKIDGIVKKAIAEKARFLRMISKERIRDEFSKIIMSGNPAKALEEMRELGVVKYVAEELEEGIGVSQNKEHIFAVWDHNLRSLVHAAEKNYSLEVRLAALFHDIGKPRAKRGEGPDSTFYNHEMIGAKMTAQILARLCFPKKFSEKVVKLVRWHLFFSDTDVITLSAVRRVVRNVGPENVWDLMNVRFCDRIGMGRPKEEPYRLRKYESMIEEALRDPISVSQLKINGEGVMKIAGIKPGPKVGFILHALLEEVLEDPSLNTEEYLGKKVAELAKMSDEELKELGIAGKEKRAEEEEKELSKIRKKYRVE